MEFTVITLREVITGFPWGIRNKGDSGMDLRLQVLYHREHKEEQKKDNGQGKLIAR